MTRASKVEACMVCWEAPCSCNAKPMRAKASRAPKVEKPAPQEELKPNLRAAMKAAAADQPHMAKMPVSYTSNTVVEMVTDQDFAKALIALDMHDMLAPEDKEKYAPILKDAKLRSQMWRERRAST